MASNDKDPIVKLNVGGVTFQTLKSTLTKHKSMFKVMLETEMPVTKDESGCIFIDRDPKKFEKVLEFLRTGRIDFSESVKIIENDSELLKIIKKIGKPILVFHVPVTNFGSIQFPVGFDFPIFKKFYAPRLNIYLKPYSTQSSVRHQEWQWTLYKKDYSEGNGPRDPRQMFGKHLEASIDGFLMD
ncbi:hypothetical protein L5515_015759 [Caenorhabditis briggsae]|uniref:BTB domain-containing protein n=1 Tax=Caenorhabditis briggsae TaxID=6238 RepID=A0AAE9EGX6_CAEBR|nr:hypothetical protein L5515_015759 [Caenorhabditis briggsae]